MKLYLTPELQAHRRGRFLASLLGISQTSELGLPKTGFVLMTGEALQASRETQEECTAWVRQPGCSLLLLPPYQKGAIIDFLDWEIELALSGSTADHQALLANILAGEMTYNLLGADGACTDDMSQQGGACHTRYWKAHSNSGLLAATTLPIWSISLLDQAALVHDFLASIETHCGLPSVSNKETKPQDVDETRPQDVTVLVCCYGFNVATADGLLSKLKTYAVPLLNLASFDLPASIVRLRNAGLIDDNGLTEKGLAHLMGCNYWAFAESLRNEA
ncbi:hypothetical protein ACE02G_14265 [Shewanella xiamenensis]|uniref:hypothetical protein n=1 Tax=Shewanella xiamenensis TaxID=332186 RepID=UPI0035B95DDD